MAIRRNSHARLQAVITGRAGKLGPIESHERNVLAITRAIHKLTRRLATLRREAAATRLELRARRREFRAVLQRDSSITMEVDSRLELAGRADAIDAVVCDRARQEKGRG